MKITDVRTVPRSRTNPQYSRDALRESLGDAGIGYEHVAALGGLRGRNRDIVPDVNSGFILMVSGVLFPFSPFTRIVPV